MLLRRPRPNKLLPLEYSAALSDQPICSTQDCISDECHATLPHHIGLLSLYSASFAHPALQLGDHGSMKTQLTSKIPVMIIAGNKEDLCSTINSHVDHRDQNIQDNASPADFTEPLPACYQRKVSHLKTTQLVKKSWKCSHFNCSVKLNWNVSDIVVEILRSLLARETQKYCRFKTPFFKIK